MDHRLANIDPAQHAMIERVYAERLDDPATIGTLERAFPIPAAALDLTELEAIVGELAGVEAERERLTTARNDYLRAAYLAGRSARDLAEVTGLSTVRIQQIVPRRGRQ